MDWCGVGWGGGVGSVGLKIRCCGVGCLGGRWIVNGLWVWWIEVWREDSKLWKDLMLWVVVRMLGWRYGELVGKLVKGR